MKRRDAAAAPLPAVLAVVETILPSYPELPAASRIAVTRDVARYVDAQIDAMPPFLRLPYRAALSAFTWLPALRFGRSFGSLSAERRGVYLDWWTDSPIAPMRDFVKLMRSSALLVYFDHPSVRERMEGEEEADVPPPAARAAHD